MWKGGRFLYEFEIEMLSRAKNSKRISDFYPHRLYLYLSPQNAGLVLSIDDAAEASRLRRLSLKPAPGVRVSTLKRNR